MIDFGILFTDPANPEVARFLAMTASLNEQCDANEITLDDLVSDDSSFRIPNNMAVLFNEFMDLSFQIKNLLELDQLKELIKDEPDQSNFWNCLIEYWENIDERRSSLQFLRDRDVDFQKNLVSTVFEKYIIHHDLPQNFNELNFEQIIEVINMLDHAKKLIVFLARSKDVFLATLKNNYALDGAISEHIWLLITKRRNNIFQIEILERIESISDAQEKLSSIMNHLIKTVEQLADKKDVCTEKDPADH